MGRGLYDSRECRGIAEQKGEWRNCLICDKKFYATNVEIKKGKGIYCSTECCGISKQDRIKCNCVSCGKEFYKWPSQKNKQHCSQECYDKELLSKRKKHVCNTCGKEFYRSQSRSIGNKHFCSDECYDLKLSNHPLWKGGLSFGKYCSKFNNRLRKRVRDNFDDHCFMCGKTSEENGRELHVHHVTYDKKICCNGEKPLFVPLCTRCHTKTNTNRDEWEIFFKYGIALHTNGIMKTF
jgi:hypothetical protein